MSCFGAHNRSVFPLEVQPKLRQIVCRTADQFPRPFVRRDGRVAEGGGLLNRCTVKSRTGGSNPPLSAIFHNPFWSDLRLRVIRDVESIHSWFSCSMDVRRDAQLPPVGCGLGCCKTVATK